MWYGSTEKMPKGDRLAVTNTILRKRRRMTEKQKEGGEGGGGEGARGRAEERGGGKISQNYKT